MVAYKYMKDEYIPRPSAQEEAAAEGAYEEYREQAQASPKHISEVIEEMKIWQEAGEGVHDPDSIMGILQDIKKRSDAITMLNEDTGE